MTTYYVSTAGNDTTNNGLSLAAPFRTPRKAATMVNAGDIVYIRGGTYSGTGLSAESGNIGWLKINRAGSNGSPITFTNYNNELVIFDGLNTYPNLGFEMGIINVDSSATYNIINGITVTNSYWDGVVFWGGFNKLTNCITKNCRWGGVWLKGNDNTAEDCEIFDCSLANYAGAGVATLNWTTAICAGRGYPDVNGKSITYRGTIRRCKVYHNWGEGIDIYEGADCLVEDCITYDNAAIQLYASNCTNTTIRRNLIYATTYSETTTGYWRGRATGIDISNELGGALIPQIDGIHIYNNLVYNCRYSLIAWWYGAGSPQMWNMHMEGNTFINGSSSVGATDGGVFFTAPGTSSVYTGCTFKSNIIIQTNGKPLLNAAPSSMVFANNCWTSTPPSGAGSAGDLVNASLGISMSGFSGTGGTLTKEYFRPIAGSNVLGKGAILPDTTPDFEGVTRSNLTPTAGALETPIGGSGVTDWLTTITPFSSANVGDTWANGTFHKSPTTGQYRIVASGGTDIFGSADGMSALYINVTGDFDFKCRVVQFNSTIEYAKIGIDVRATLDAGSEHYALVKQMNELNVNGLSRVSVGATTSQNYLTGTGANNWLRVRKTGSSLEFMYGIDGVTWTTESTKTLTGWSDSVYACMVACSKSPTLTATAIFDNVSLVQSLPYPWASADVGAVVIAGSSQYASGVYTVNGAGADIWGTVDAFHYVYRQYTGDFDAKVRIPTGPTPITNNYAKAGLMARGSLANNAANIIVTLLPIGSVESVARSTDGGDSFVRERVTDASKWVRLVRQGNVFKTYYSSDGATWTALSTDLTLTLPSTVYLGLAVCSHNTTALTTATFDNISIGAVSSNVSQMFLLDM